MSGDRKEVSQSCQNGHAETCVGVPRPFLVERFFAKHEFTAQYMLGSSDAEAWSVRELLDIAASKGDVAAAAEWENVTMAYTESQGHPQLRESISKLYGHPIGPDQILCMIPAEGIYVTMSALLRSGDVVVAMQPDYQSLHEIARSKGCTVAKWNARYELGTGWSFSVDDLRSAFDTYKGNVKMLIINVPHNPTSWMPTAQEHQEIISICREHGAWLFSDEMYWGITDIKDVTPTCVQYEKAISLGGLSKPCGMPGLRVGWVATQCKETMEKFANFKDYVSICGASPSETLAIIALRHFDVLVQRAKDTEQKNRKLLESFCTDFSEIFEWVPKPRVGLVCLVVLKGWARDMGPQQFADWVVENASCVVVPSNCFIEGPHTPAVRFGLGRLNFGEALEKLRPLLQVGPGKSKN